jgi:hypothetical protein
MDPTYESVVETSGLIWTMLAYVVHAGFAGLQGALVLYLSVTGVRALLQEPDARAVAGLRLAAAVALSLPALLGAPFSASFIGCGLALLLALRQPAGWRRRGLLGATVLVAAFGLFEVEDPAALGLQLFADMQGRSQHLEWQIQADRHAPKVGDLAPDFSLEDPSGVTRVRLSDFRGKRPVALMFGSYT